MPQIWIIFLIIFINMLGFGVLIPLLPTFEVIYNLTAFQYGVLGAVFPLLQMFSAPILGRISDRHGRKKTIVISFILMSFSYIILAMAKSYEMLLLSRALGGFFAGSFVVAFACAADISDKAHRAKYMGIASMGFGFGFMLGPTIGALFAGTDTLNANIMGTAIFAFIISIIATALTFKFLPETLPQKYTGNTLIIKEITLIVKNMEDSINFSLSALISMIIAGIEVFLSLFLVKQFAYNPLEIGIFWTLFALILNFGRVLLLRYIHTYLHIALAFFTIALAFIIYVVTHSIVWVYIASYIIAMASGILITVINSKISINADPQQQGLYLGLSNAAGNLGRMLGPYTMGYIIHLYHDTFEMSWIFLSIMSLLAVFNSLVLYRKKRHG